LGAVMDLAGWLRSLGLEQYEAIFRENAIDETILPDLTDYVGGNFPSMNLQRFGTKNRRVEPRSAVGFVVGPRVAWIWTGDLRL